MHEISVLCFSDYFIEKAAESFSVVYKNGQCKCMGGKIKKIVKTRQLHPTFQSFNEDFLIRVGKCLSMLNLSLENSVLIQWYPSGIC
jgi:hypothetical protein